MRLAAAAALLFGLALIASTTGRVDARAALVSPYTFNRDVRPILQRRCVQCHVPGGVGPTSFATYHDAVTQAWSMRQALMSGRMPPWSAKPGAVALNEQQSLTAHELDVLMSWASGGTPEGSATAPDDTRPAIPDSPAIAAAPDLTIQMPAPYVLPAGAQNADYEVVLPSDDVRGTWIRAVDVVPDARAIVRRAQVLIRVPEGEQIVGLWLPGDVPQMLGANAAFFVPANGSLVLQVHYQRPRPGEAAAIADRSRVAVYLSPAPAAQVESLTVIAARQLLTKNVRVVSFRPIQGPADAIARVVAVATSGARTSLLRLQLRPDWPRRYVLTTPLPLPRGTVLDVSVVRARADVWQTLIETPASVAASSNSFRGAIEVVD